jgi:hypothetical protein
MLINRNRLFVAVGRWSLQARAVVASRRFLSVDLYWIPWDFDARTKTPKERAEEG